MYVRGAAVASASTIEKEGDAAAAAVLFSLVFPSSFPLFLRFDPPPRLLGTTAPRENSDDHALRCVFPFLSTFLFLSLFFPSLLFFFVSLMSLYTFTDEIPCILGVI